MLDADGPGQLLGFVYGARLLDDIDRWSHGGAENIYLDGGRWVRSGPSGRLRAIERMRPGIGSTQLRIA